MYHHLIGILAHSGGYAETEVADPLELKQGSAEWHKFRSRKITASSFGTALGCGTGSLDTRRYGRFVACRSSLQLQVIGFHTGKQLHACSQWSLRPGAQLD